jgi:hypothetical protein
MQACLQAPRLRTALAALAVLTSPAWADDRPRDAAPVLNKTYVAECAACHVAYPPSMLPAASWLRLMGNLGRHYGSDASLDAKDIALITPWLLAQAGTRRSAATPPPDDRITRSDWFVRKHRGIEPATWQLPSVRSASNCMACHSDAKHGTFSERALR